MNLKKFDADASGKRFKSRKSSILAKIDFKFYSWSTHISK